MKRLSTFAPARQRFGRPRCEWLEGRFLLNGSFDYLQVSSAMQAGWEALSSLPTMPNPLELSLDLSLPPSKPQPDWDTLNSSSLIGSSPRTLFVDLDGDGLLDRVELAWIEGSNTDRLDVFRGLENGGWELVRRTTLGYLAQSLMAEDFDGNGNVDLFIPGDAPGTGTLLLNLGDWQFEVCQRLAARGGMAVADLTGNGRHDFVLSQPLLDHVSVELGDQNTVIVGGAFAPGAVQLADLDGNGQLDLIVSAGAGGVRIYPGLGGGRFGEEIGGALGLSGFGPVHVVVAYLNDVQTIHPQTGEHYDPYLDLIVLSVTEGSATIFYGEGGWRFRRGETLDVGLVPSSVQVYDVSGNGLLDMIVTSRGTNQVRILSGLGRGRFDDQFPRILPVGHLPVESFLADFDGDDLLDLVVLNAGSNDVTFYSNVASLMTTPQTIPTGGVGAIAALLTDLDGDGIADLVVANHQNGTVSWLRGGSQGLSLYQTVAMPTTRPMALAGAGESGKVYVAGENGNGVEVVSFYLSPPLIHPPVDGSEPPPATPSPIEAKLEAPSANVIGLFPTLVTRLRDDNPMLSRSNDDEDALVLGEVVVESEQENPNLSGGCDEDEEVEEEAEQTSRAVVEQAVQRFLLGVDETPPPQAPLVEEEGEVGEQEIEETTELLVEEGEATVWIELDEATTEEESPILPSDHEEEKIDVAIEAVVMLMVLAIAQDRQFHRTLTGRKS